jgi:hypothetical protein
MAHWAQGAMIAATAEHAPGALAMRFNAASSDFANVVALLAGGVPSLMIQRHPLDPIVTRDNPSGITLDITPHNLLGPFLPFPNHVGDHTISYETSLAKSA